MDKSILDNILDNVGIKSSPKETKDEPIKGASLLDKIRTKVPESKKRKPADPDDDNYIPVGVNGLLAASEKLLAVNRGLEQPDNRDSLAFKKFMTTDKLMAERVAMDHGRVRGAIVPVLAKQRSLRALHPFAFDNYMRGYLMGNPLVSPLEEINPIHLVEQSRRASQMGVGGIGVDRAITEDMQNVEPGQFGFLSTIEGPESEKIGVDVRFAWGTKMGSDGKPYQIMYDRRLGRYRWVSPYDLWGKVVKLPD